MSSHPTCHQAAVVLHVPHASAEVPADVRQQFVLTDDDLDAELRKITDWFTDELFDLPADVATVIRFPVSRLVVDPERFTDDAIEPMAARGMGMVYSCKCDGNPLRDPLEPAARERLIARFYQPHHERFKRAVARALDDHDRCLIVDAHSFPDRPLACHAGMYDENDSPDVCIGTDPFHTPGPLCDSFVEAYRRAGWTVSVDAPFRGAIVPAAFYRQDRRVQSVMVELNRRLYMDETDASRLPAFDEVRRAIARVLRGVLMPR